MGGEESRSGGSAGARVLLLRARGCSVCLALDAVEGVYVHPLDGGSATQPVGIVDWPGVSGLGAPPGEDEGGCLVIVRTDAGAIGLRVDACLGVRDVSFLQSPPIPTRLVDKEGRPLCYLLLLDHKPHFLIEPRAVVDALQNERPEPASSGIASIASRVAIGG